MLHLPTVTFKPTNINTVEITSPSVLGILEDLTGVSKDIIRTVLTLAVAPSYYVPLSLKQAQRKIRETVSGVYFELFLWIIKKINNILNSKGESLDDCKKINIIYTCPYVVNPGNTSDCRDVLLNVLNDKYRILCINQGILDEVDDCRIKEVRKEFCGFDKRGRMSIRNILGDIHFQHRADSDFYHKSIVVYQNHPLFTVCPDSEEPGYLISHLYQKVFYRKEEFARSSYRYADLTWMDFFSSTSINILTDIFKKTTIRVRGSLRIDPNHTICKNRNLSMLIHYFFFSLFEDAEKSEIILVDSGMTKTKSAKSFK